LAWIFILRSLFFFYILTENLRNIYRRLNFLICQWSHFYKLSFYLLLLVILIMGTKNFFIGIFFYLIRRMRWNFILICSLVILIILLRIRILILRLLLRIIFFRLLNYISLLLLLLLKLLLLLLLLLINFFYIWIRPNYILSRLRPS
jgi:hypothetical protein